MHAEAGGAALRVAVRPLSTLVSNLRAVQPEPEPGKQPQQQQQKAGSGAADSTLAQHLRGSWRRLARPVVEEWMASVSPAAEGSAADASAVSLPWCARACAQAITGLRSAPSAARHSVHNWLLLCSQSAVLVTQLWCLRCDQGR